MEEQKQDKKEAIADAAQKISDNKEVRHGAPKTLFYFTAKRCHSCRKGLRLVVKSTQFQGVKTCEIDFTISASMQTMQAMQTMQTMQTMQIFCLHDIN